MGRSTDLSNLLFGKGAFMSHPKEKDVEGRLVSIISDAFNRSLNALEKAGAIDTKKMREHYKGVGSKYYDVVTEQIELTAKSGAPWVRELFAEKEHAPKKQ
jgi:hypothetical protein